MIDVATIQAKLDELTKQRDQLIANLQAVAGAMQFAQVLLDEAAKTDASTQSESAKVDAS